MQHWRGMVELGSLMQDFPSESCGTNGTLAAELLAEAARFKTDIDAALARSVVRNASGQIIFVPAAVTPGRNNATPYTTMTQDTVASYSNFRYRSISLTASGLRHLAHSMHRYYSEMLSSGFMDAETSTALMDFRETRGGCLSGMTRFTDHLDDM